jgi:K+-sensing histidine kinase KdpD
MLTEELRASELERKRLEQMKEEWIVNISHDIKTPLASIQGYAELMRQKDYDLTFEEMRDYAEIIEQKSLYLKELIEDLNLSTRLRNKDLVLNLKSVNMVSLVRNTVIDMLNETPYGNRNIDFHHSDEVILKDIDEILLRRAVSNLIYNAVVHNSEDVSIFVNVDKAGDMVRITVEDQGRESGKRNWDGFLIGITAVHIHKGSGLGMAIINDIVKAHGGEINVTSEVGSGTRIEILL